MALKSLYHTPRRLDKFFDSSRIAKGLQPNGYICQLYREDGEITSVLVKFFDVPPEKITEETVQYERGLIDGNYKNETIGYIIEP